MNNKVIFLDLDGTLLDDQKNVPEVNKQAIDSALAAGHKVCICTGRPLCGILHMLPGLGLDKEGCYAIVNNGAGIYDVFNKEIIYKKTLTIDQFGYIFNKAREWGIYMQVYTEDEILYENDMAEGRIYTRNIKIERRQVLDAIAALEGQAPYKALAVAFAEDHDRLLAFKDSFKGWAEENIDIYASCVEFMEFVPKGINKGNAIRFMAEIFNIPMENTIAVGDADNDLSMIKVAGIGVAMNNAEDEIKNTADYVTERNNNDGGVAEVIYKFMI